MLVLELIEIHMTRHNLNRFLYIILTLLTLTLYHAYNYYSNADHSLTTLVCPNDCWVELSFFLSCFNCALFLSSLDFPVGLKIDVST